MGRIIKIKKRQESLKKLSKFGMRNKFGMCNNFLKEKKNLPDCRIQLKDLLEDSIKHQIFETVNDVVKP